MYKSGTWTMHDHVSSNESAKYNKSLQYIYIYIYIYTHIYTYAQERHMWATECTIIFHVMNQSIHRLTYQADK